MLPHPHSTLPNSNLLSQPNVVHNNRPLNVHTENVVVNINISHDNDESDSDCSNDSSDDY
jgi:hypothetical protein